MKYVFLGIFIIASVIHLYASLKKDKKLRGWSKIFIVSSLLGWYWVAADKVMPVFLLALFFSWLGDVLLIPNSMKLFTAGGISFGVSHILFILTYNKNVNFSLIPLWIIIVAAVVYITAACFVFKGLKNHLPKPLFYPMFFYLLANGLMNCFALYQLLSVKNTAALIVFIGAALFFCSDSVLFYTRFKKDTIFKNHFVVMLTYIFAEFLIVLGTLMF